RLDEKVLAKERHLSVAILSIKVDDLFQGFDRRPRAQRGQIRIQVSLEFIEQHFQLRVIELALSRNVCRIDNDRAALFHDVEAVVDNFVDGIIKAETLTVNTDPSTPQPIRVKKLAIVCK